MTRIIESLLRMLDVDEALIGDLLEQRHRGRSSGWFVRQGLTAAATACYSQWLTHKWLALRSVAVGAAAVFALRKAAWFPQRAATRFFGLTVGNYLLEANHDTLRQAFMGYHLYDLPVTAFTCITYALAGWLVARTVRQHQMAMVLLFALLVQAWWAFDIIAWTRGAMQVPRANLYPYLETVEFCLLMPSIVCGARKALPPTRLAPISR